MNLALWIIAATSAAAFMLAGLAQVTLSKETLTGLAPAVAGLPASALRLIGVAEILGALGLVLPGVLKVATVLTPVAAAALAVTMAGGAIYHLRRREAQSAVAPVVLLLAMAFVAAMRFGPHPL